MYYDNDMYYEFDKFSDDQLRWYVGCCFLDGNVSERAFKQELQALSEEELPVLRKVLIREILAYNECAETGRRRLEESLEFPPEGDSGSWPAFTPCIFSHV